MDRIGSFAVVAALVLLSALHIVSAPNYLNLIPAVLGIFGLVRLATTRSAAETPATEELALAPAAEA